MALVEFTQEGKLGILTLNRPEVMNALNKETLLSLILQFEKIQNKSNVWVLAIKGAGEKAFCAGADLKERKGMSLADTREAVQRISHCFSKLASLKIPTVALINGFAFGGGLELALACDFRICSENSSMGLTETSLGIIPGAGGTQRLPRIVGLAKAKELILKAQRVSAQEAKNMGLVNEVFSKVQFEKEARNWIAPLLENAPLALQAAKNALDQGWGQDAPAGLQIEQVAYGTILETNDRLIALDAFAGKRKPVFVGA